MSWNISADLKGLTTLYTMYVGNVSFLFFIIGYFVYLPVLILESLKLSSPQFTFSSI